jgi:hypothetical protein
MTARKWTIFGLVVTALAIMGYKVLILGFSPAVVVPVKGYKVDLLMSVKGHGLPINVRTYLPNSNRHQSITQEVQVNGVFAQTVEQDERGNRLGVWHGDPVDGFQEFSYSFFVSPREIKYNLPEPIPRIQNIPDSLSYWLNSTELVQTNDSSIIAQSQLLGLDSLSDMRLVVRRVYDYVQNQIRPAKFSGETSALTTLQLGEASCNGKSRLVVALLRHEKIPSRLVGGMILEEGEKRVVHQWVEVFLGTEWVSLDALNAHLFTLPANYLELYRDDETLFRRTSNIHFKYSWQTTSVLVPRGNGDDASWKRHKFLALWALFQEAGISMDVLRVLLMIPFGALITVLFRNMGGITTFGTFLPVLIATAYRDTGVLWGHASFMLIILSGAAMRPLLNRLKLLHTPRLTIILVLVVLEMLGLTLLGIYSKQSGLTHASLFPIAIMAITIERFSVTMEEKGFQSTFWIFVNTLVVVTFCYLGMLSVFLQTMVLAFPEVMLLVIATAVYLGGWTGLRVMELWRFRRMIFAREGAV